MKDNRRKNRKKANEMHQVNIVKALNHPVRAQALTILIDRVASPKEIAEQIGVRLTNVSYHIRVLEELGLIEITAEQPARGSVAHFYKAVGRSLFDGRAGEMIDPTVRSALWSYLKETLLMDAATSLKAGYLDKRRDRRASRTRLLLDEEGWKAAVAIQEEALDRIVREQKAAAKRMSGPDGGIEALLAMFLFEMPPEASG